jgi:DNA polymerase-1
MTKRLAIIDGKSVFYRGYYAMPGLSTRDGTPTGGVYGFAALSLELIKKLKPDYVIVAWDKPKTNIRKRKELYPDYKAGRKPAPDDFYVQIPMLHELLDAFGWPLYECDDYEADDIMGTLAHKAEQQDIETCLITSDLDALQCVSPLTHVYAMKKGFTNIELFHPESFEAKYGIRVDQFLDLKALKGDSSDNIPGVPGIGEKTAVKLLQDYDTLDGVYEHIDELKGAVRTKLETGKELAYLSKKIAEIWLDAPVDLDLAAADVNDLDRQRLHDTLVRLEFRTLLKSLPDNMQNQGQSELFAVEANAPVLEPAAVEPFDDAMKSQLSQASVAVVTLGPDGDWFVSPKRGIATRVDPIGALEAIAGGAVVGHNVKPLLRKAVEQVPAIILPRVAHDTQQAAFLLDSLMRSHDLGEIVGVDVSDPAVAITAVWDLYWRRLPTCPRLRK